MPQRKVRASVGFALSPRQMTQIENILVAEGETGVRNVAAISLMANTGVRLRELLGLLWADIGLMSGRVCVEGPGRGQARVLWAGSRDNERLAEWRHRQLWRHPNPVMQRWGLRNLARKQLSAVSLSAKPLLVFATLEGKPLSSRYAQSMMRRIGQRIDLPWHLSPANLRRRYAQALYGMTHDVNLVRYALGVRSLQAVEKLLDLGECGSSSALRSLSPVAD